MPFLLVMIGAVLLVAAIRNTQGDLATALETDVPGFLVWGLALGAVGALGYVPGMKQVSRGLLALVLVVLVLQNYTKLFAGLSLQSITGTAAGTPATDPATAYTQNPSAPAVTTAGITGTSGGGAASVGSVAQAATTSPLGAFDPAAFVTAFSAGVGGFGGVV